jgi:putative addiction module component (TIGR02574 family)
MSRTVEDLIREAAELPEQDRAALAGLLIESLEGPPDPDVDAAWAAEIERRVADVDAGRVTTVPWEEVRERLRQRLG